jgi:NADPH-dependent glutamate synthase beta subunit-like oxidoreductase
MGVLPKEVMENMKDIVDNCMGDSNPACQSSCPMHTDIKEYVRLVGEGDGEGAIGVIREKLFLPKTLGRVCAHPCEAGCRRGDEDKPISVANIKRYAADNFDNPINWDLKKKSATGKKVAVIGAGPAGAQAAIDLSKNGHEVTIYDKLPVLGGMMRVGIPAYRLPRQIIDEEYSILEMLGVKISLGVEIGVDIDFDTLKNENDAVIIAVGRQAGRIDKSLKNHNAIGVYSAAEYLKEISLTGESKGAGKRIAVIGGGDVAMDCARSSLRIPGVEKVYSVCLEPSYEEMTSSIHEVKGAIAEGVNFNLAMGTNEILTDDAGRVKALEIKECISIFDSEGNFNPKCNEDNKKMLDVDTVVFAIGQGVDAGFDKKESVIKRKNGTFETDELTMQSVTDKKVFVAGDCASAVIVIDAMAEGRRAAISADRFMRGEDLRSGRNMEEEGAYKTKLDLPTEYLPEGWDSAEKIERVTAGELDPMERIKSFNETEFTYTKEQAEREANRCLQCTCKLCMKECIMLNDFTDCPKTLFEEYLEKGYAAMDPKISYSCNACSQCTLKCPKDFDMQGAFMGMRPEYIKDNGGKSPMKGHQAIEVHQYLGYSKFFNTSNKAPAEKKTKYVFFPGCSLPSYNPEAVGNVLGHLQDKLEGGVGSVLKCCGKPTKALGQKEKFKERFGEVQAEIDKLGADTVIVACQSCLAVFSEYLKQDVVSLWTLLPEIGLPDDKYGIGEESDVVFNIHDSCSARERHDLHDGIRWIVDKMGYKVEELENSREKTRCCGFGGMVVPANPDVAGRVMKRRAEETTTGHMISYCAACRESMESGGTDSLHILDLLFGDTYTTKKIIPRNMGPVKQWMNRYKSKQELNKKSK